MKEAHACKSLASLTIVAQCISFLPSRSIFALLIPLFEQLNLSSRRLFSSMFLQSGKQSSFTETIPPTVSQRRAPSLSGSGERAAIGKAKDALNAIIQGLIRNPTVTIPPLLVFIHMLATVPFKPIGRYGVSHNAGFGPPLPYGHAIIPVEFALTLLLSGLRHHRIDGRTPLHVRMLNPFVPILLRLLGATKAEHGSTTNRGVVPSSRTVVTLSLRILTLLIKPPWGRRIAAVKNLNWKILLNRVFVLMTEKRDAEMVRTCFSFFAQLVRCVPGVLFSGDQIHLLVAMVSQELDDVKARGH